MSNAQQLRMIRTLQTQVQISEYVLCRLLEVVRTTNPEYATELARTLKAGLQVVIDTGLGEQSDELVDGHLAHSLNSFLQAIDG